MLEFVVPEVKLLSKYLEGKKLGWDKNVSEFSSLWEKCESVQKCP